MKAPDEVSARLRLKGLGWGSKRIAAELGCSRNTVRHWQAQGDWRRCASPSRSKKLDGLSEWLRERFRRHAGNADVVRQELAHEKSISISLRAVERAVAPLRRELVAAAGATVRFETQPGEQLQIDFGERRVGIGGVAVKIFLFVATLGFTPSACPRLRPREARQLVRRHGARVPRFRRSTARGSARQCQGADPAS